MKISKRQLRRIIKEEKAKLINEANPTWKRINQAIADPSGAIFSGSGSVDEDELRRLASPDAWKLFKAIAGLGTDKETVLDVLSRRKDDIPALNSEFNELRDELIAQRKKTSTWLLSWFGSLGMPTGPILNAVMIALQKRDLAGWLDGDGMSREAQMVRDGLAVNEGRRSMVTKKQLQRIIREEKARLLSEQEEGIPPTGDHHWPRVEWSNIGELTDKWMDMEEKAWDKGDPSMNPDDETDADAKRYWKDQVEGCAMDMEAELTLRIRKVALQTMKEFSNKLIDGEYA